MLLISSWMEFWFVGVVSKYLKTKSLNFLNVCDMREAPQDFCTDVLFYYVYCDQIF